MLKHAGQAAVATCLVALANFVLPQLRAAPDVGEPKTIADFPEAFRNVLMSVHICNLPALSSAGNLAATGERDGFWAVQIWDVRRSQVSSSLTGHSPKKRAQQAQDFETALTFSANGQTLVACDDRDESPRNNFLRIWTGLSGDPKPIQIPVSQLVFAVSPDGHLVAGVGRAQKAISIWDAKSGDAVMELPFAKKGTPGPARDLLGMIFTPDGKELVLHVGVAERQGKLVAFGVTPATTAPTAGTGRVIAQTNGDGYELESFKWNQFEFDFMKRSCQGRMAFLNGGKTLVTLNSKINDWHKHDAEWQIHYWDMAAGGEQRPPTTFSAKEPWRSSCALSPYGDVLALTTEDRQRIRVLDLATGKTRFEIAFPAPSGGPQQVRITDPATGEPRIVIAVPAKTKADSLFLDASGKYLGAVISSGPRLRVWEPGPPADGDSRQPASAGSGSPLPH